MHDGTECFLHIKYIDGALDTAEVTSSDVL